MKSMKDALGGFFRNRLLIRSVVVTVAALACGPGFCEAAAPPAAQLSKCRAVAAMAVADTRITDAQWITADTPIQVVYAPAPFHGLPAHCLVRGVVGSHAGKDGITYGDRFELRLPADWNGRFLFQGGGGLDGFLMPAVGLVSEAPDSHVPTALARGFAVVSTDGGHEQATLKTPGAFGDDPRARADYEYNSTRVVAGAALAITKAYYGHAARWTYFLGCSNGGREGMIAAQRYPSLFNGVVAGSPAFDLTGAMVDEAWNTDAFAAIAPRGPDGRPELSQALSDSDLHLLARAVLSRCDASDGSRDGLIGNPAACHFDPAVLACRAGQPEACLSSAKIAAIRRVFSGPVDSRGRHLYTGFPYDAGIAASGWRQWMLGTKRVPAINAMIAPTAINDMVLRGSPPAIDLWKFDFDTGPARIDRAAPRLNADSTDYDGMKQHHGKLLLYAGLSDPVFSADDLVAYYRRVIAANGGVQATQRFARLFLVPGMNHCGGGPTLDRFDTLSAIENWVEHDEPPSRLIASGKAFPGRTRPLCPYPSAAHYRGAGDPRKAASFVCR